MNTNIIPSFQIKLIAFGLLAIIPITIDLGLKFIFPKTDWNTYRTLENEYMKKNMPNYDKYQKELEKSDDFRYPQSTKRANLLSSHKEYVKKWEESEQYKDLKNKDKKHNQYRMVTLCFLIIAIMLFLMFIPIPIIHAAIMWATLFLFIFNLNQFLIETNDSFLSIPLSILKILTSLICLILTSYIVYKNND